MISDIKCIFHEIFHDIETVGDVFNLFLFILLVVLLSPFVLLDALMTIPIRNKHD